MFHLIFTTDHLDRISLFKYRIDLQQVEIVVLMLSGLDLLLLKKFKKMSLNIGKMPFIWNDDRMELVDHSSDYDKSENVIVRKLFLQFKERAKDVNEQWIRNTFNGYGHIESIEVTTKSNENTWAYLTYSKDDEAHRALTDASKLDEIDVILPADTWCQPSSFSYTEPDDETVVNALRDFDGQRQPDRSVLLRKLISLSTKSKSTLLEEELNNRILPSVKKFDFQLTDGNGTAISLNEVRSILKCIGPHISELGVHFRMDKYPKYVNRYFYKICQYVGSNLGTLRLKGVPSNQDWLVRLKPLLGQIECLHLSSSNYDFEYDIDFQLYCPNIKTLKLSMNLNGTLLSEKQPKLQRLTNLQNQFMEESLVLEFMKNNPQLVYLKIQANDCNNLLKQIPSHMAKLEKLCLYQGYPNITAENLEHLTSMKQLKKLKLMYLDEEDFNDILNCLPKFRQLEELKLHLCYDGLDSVDLEEAFVPNFDLIVTLAQELSNLECFHIRYCCLDAETLNNFIRYARKLRTLGIYRCGFEITDTFLEDIESIRRAVNPTMVVLHADKIDPKLNREITYSYVKLVTL